MAESVKIVCPGRISLLATKHRPDEAVSPTVKGNCEGRLGLRTPSLSLTSSIPALEMVESLSYNKHITLSLSLLHSTTLTQAGRKLRETELVVNL